MDESLTPRIVKTTTLYGDDFDVDTRALLAILEHLKEKVEYENAEIFEEKNKLEEFKLQNPTGSIPFV